MALRKQEVIQCKTNDIDDTVRYLMIVRTYWRGLGMKWYCGFLKF